MHRVMANFKSYVDGRWLEAGLRKREATKFKTGDLLARTVTLRQGDRRSNALINLSRSNDDTQRRIFR